MLIPDNEGKACDAVVKSLEKWTGATRASIRHPERDGEGPPVDCRLKLGTHDYAIEHTRIEPFENEIKALVAFNKISRHVKSNIPNPFPSSAYYELQLESDVSLPNGNAMCNRALNNLVEWVQANERSLRDRNVGRSLLAHNPRFSDDCIQGTPEGFDCTFALLHWPDAALIRRNPGDLRLRFNYPDDLEPLRAKRLRRAFSAKCPKLGRCKAEGARAVLVLESRGLGHTNFEHIGRQLPMLLADREDAPDEIYLMDTETELWWLWLMKRDGDHWPAVGMPKWGPIYEADRLPTQGIPKLFRDALGLDELYTPCLPGWAPATFWEKELEDLSRST